MRHTIPSVIPSSSAIRLASSSLRWARLRVFTWSNEITGRPASVTSLRALLAIRSVVSLAQAVKSLISTSWVHKKQRMFSFGYSRVR